MITGILTLAGGVCVMCGCGVVGAATLKFLNTFELNVPTKLKTKSDKERDRKPNGRGINNKVEQGRSKIGSHSRPMNPFGEDY